MPFTRLHRLLDANHVEYQTIAHPTTYSAQQTAAAAHIPGRELAKTVIVDIDGNLAMVVQNASSMVPLGRLKAATGARDVHLASEQEFRDCFPDCELGAMPPFGNLYGMEVFVAEALTKDEEIAFDAGSHTELIKLRYGDFARLVHPVIV
jgi:Ala-tRNA(Pro) deacylase